MSQEFLIDKIQLGDSIGVGSLGQVFKAIFKNTPDSEKHPFAVKIIDPSQFYEGQDHGERFMREAEALSRLKHRAIVGYHHVGFTIDASRRPYIAMEFVEGSRLVDIAPSMTMEERVGAMMEVLAALDHSHEKSVLHRDVKPTNILVRKSDKQAILVDFGLAYVWEGMSTQTVTKFGAGSMGYIPPEVQVDPRNRSVKHDIFSAGVSLYEILANRRPTFGNYSPLAEIDPALAGLDPIIRRAISSSEERQRSAKEFHDELSNWRARRQVMSALPASPRLENLKARLQSENKQREEAERVRKSRADSIASQEIAHHNLILAMAEKAMMDSHAIALDAGRKIRFIKVKSFNLPNQKSTNVSEYFALNSEGEDRQIVFGASREIMQPLGHRRKQALDFDEVNPGLLRSGVAPQSISNVQFLGPVWLLTVRGGGRSPERMEQGRIVCGIQYGDMNSENPQLRIFRNYMMSQDGKQRLPPAELVNPDDVYDYLVYVVASAI